jgi:arylformamidase
MAGLNLAGPGVFIEGITARIGYRCSFFIFARNSMPRHTAAWHDAQYNNRARVADQAQILRRWAVDSKLARERAVCQLDLSYASTASREAAFERLDLFAPAAVTDPASPVLVIVHGGYWRSLDKSDMSFLAKGFTDAGALVVIPNYSLCPAVGIDRIAMQLAESLAWVWRHAAEHGGDPRRIVVVGHSAGGHLAAMLSCCDWQALGADLPRDLVKGALSISGVHDLEPLLHTPFLQADLQLDAALVKKVSPVLFPAPASPLYALAGGSESAEFKRQNRIIQQAWGKRAVPVCEEIAGRNHFDILDDLALSDGRCHQLTRRLLGL